MSELRPARSGDAAAIRTLVRAAYAKWVPLINREPKPMTADYAKAVRDHVVFVLEEERHLLAVLEMIPESDHLLVENVAVDTSAQGRGLGRKLMAFAEAEARRRGLSEIRLYTNERFTANVRLYEAIGYTIFDREPIGTSVAVWMRKPLME